MEPAELLNVLDEVANAIGLRLVDITDWGPSGVREGQYGADLVVDRIALDMLRRANFGILSEESGAENLDREFVVIVDPLDGSTNASRGVPHYATSLCAVDASGPVVALVVDQATKNRWWAVRGAGSFKNGRSLRRDDVSVWSRAMVAISGVPPHEPGWGQFRALGASAIDLCYVADATVDAFIDMSPSAHGVWDYAAAMLICHEAGVQMADAQGRDLLVMDHTQRRTPVAAPTGIFAEALRLRKHLPL